MPPSNATRNPPQPGASRAPFSDISNAPKDNAGAPQAGEPKPKTRPDPFQPIPGAAPNTPSRTGLGKPEPASQSFEEAEVAWLKKTPAEKEEMYLATYGSKEPPWASIDKEPYDDGADIDYELAAGQPSR